MRTAEVATDVPYWMRVGYWVRSEDNDYFEVVGVMDGVRPNIVVMLREWQKEKILSMHLNAAMEQFRPTLPPLEPQSWHRWIMAEDEY